MQQTEVGDIVPLDALINIFKALKKGDDFPMPRYVQDGARLYDVSKPYDQSAIKNKLVRAAKRERNTYIHAGGGRRRG